MASDDRPFFQAPLKNLLSRSLLQKDSSIVVVCGGPTDKVILEELGFTNVTITNLDQRLEAGTFHPYSWEYQDAEALTFGDGTFDFGIVHQGLHHCRSPHRALLELYRVSRIGILGIEPRDSIWVRLLVKLGFGEDFELAAVVGNGFSAGGLRNSAIPNFVYRWSKREILKTLNSYSPWETPEVVFFNTLRINWERFSFLKSGFLKTAIRFGTPLLEGLSKFFPALGNRFGFLVLRPYLGKNLKPWIFIEDGKASLRKEWLTKRYR